MRLLEGQEFVLAMEISNETYFNYLALPAREHHDLKVMNGCYIVMRPQTQEWAWTEKGDFENFYTPIEDPASNRFTWYVSSV